MVARGESRFSGPLLYLLRRSVWGVRRRQQQVVSRGGLRAGSGLGSQGYILKHFCSALTNSKTLLIEETDF
ncbi:hypothetical protein E2C01_075382 [Portunus trituberculatus]|uniref:Uncharacterized protein n=1 Tax=Portunus trituberculatus TaxID=210409 RepID=A0A5B7IG00_PORTR|nr:hypothetical protein [Portunus trituberculatus]